MTLRFQRVTQERAAHKVSGRGGSPLTSCAALLLLVSFLSGCITPWERDSLIGSRAGIDNVQGPTERRLRSILKGDKKTKDEDSLVEESGSLKPIPGTDEYLAAEELYNNGDYKAAEQAFHHLAQKHRNPAAWTKDLLTGKLIANKPHPNDSIREDSLYMEAESAYKQKHYADAYDAYAGLLKDYPSSRHLDEVTKRLFETSRMWLGFPRDTAISEIAQVNYDDFHHKRPPQEPAKAKHTPVFVPNFFDEERPLFDTEGNAISALRLIWLNDPTGPLADDALMMTASYYARRGNWIEADRHYTLLREEYPNSPHVQTAFVLGSHVKLMSYEGAAYDGKTLEDAEHLKESTLRLYPALDDRKRIEGELDRIEEAKADRLWQLVEFYEGKRKPRAAAIYCHLVIEQFPKSEAAEKARQRLQKLGPEYANGTKLMSPVDDPPFKLWAEPGSAFKRQDPPRLFGVIWGEPGAAFKPQDPPRLFGVIWGEPGSAFQRYKMPPKAKTTSLADEDVIAEAKQQPSGESHLTDGDEGEGDGDSRKGRWFRFSPPKRLTPDEEAKPNPE